MTSKEIAQVRNPPKSNFICSKCGCEHEKKFEGLHLCISVKNAQNETVKEIPVWICDRCQSTFMREE